MSKENPIIIDEKRERECEICDCKHSRMIRREGSPFVVNLCDSCIKGVKEAEPYED